MPDSFFHNLVFIKTYFTAELLSLFNQNQILMITTICVASIFIFIFKMMKRKFFIFTLLTLPGTFMHESMHYLVSLLTNGKPSRFSLWPKKQNDIYIMGYVLSRNVRWYNGLLIGMAPFLLYIIAFFFYRESLVHETILMFLVLKIYFIANLFESGIPSSQDFKVALTNPLGILILIGLLCVNWGYVS